MVYGDNPAAVSRNNCLAYRKPDSHALVAVRLGLFRTISLTVENRLKPVFVYADSVSLIWKKTFSSSSSMVSSSGFVLFACICAFCRILIITC